MVFSEARNVRAGQCVGRNQFAIRSVLNDSYSRAIPFFCDIGWISEAILTCSHTIFEGPSWHCYCDPAFHVLCIAVRLSLVPVEDVLVTDGKGSMHQQVTVCDADSVRVAHTAGSCKDPASNVIYLPTYFAKRVLIVCRLVGAVPLLRSLMEDGIVEFLFLDHGAFE